MARAPEADWSTSYSDPTQLDDFTLDKMNGPFSDEVRKAHSLKYVADGGDMQAAFEYGMQNYNWSILLSNRGVAVHYLKLAADGGHREAQFVLARMLETGELGVSADATRSAYYYKLAADGGHGGAQSKLAVDRYTRLMASGEATQEDKRNASLYFKEAADRGDKNAQWSYGRMLYEGDGIRARKTMAADYLRTAADQGVAGAQFLFGRQLDEGDGIRMDNQLAGQYLKMAADNHYPGADVAYREWRARDDSDL
jgi:TPR repeat protein